MICPPETGIFTFGLNGLPLIGPFKEPLIAPLIRPLIEPFIVGALENGFTGPVGILGRFAGVGNLASSTIAWATATAAAGAGAVTEVI